MSITGIGGRFGNSVIRNFAVSIIATKFNLKVTYWRYSEFKRLGLDLFSGAYSYLTTVTLTDENYFSIYHSSQIRYNIASPYYYQIKEITDQLYAYLRTEKVRDKIKACNPFRERYQKNQDVFVHIRLGDVPIFSPGMFYYVNTLQSLSFDHLYLSTDSPEDPMVKHLLQAYPSTLVLEDEVTTLQFASTAKYVVLSHGTFSGIMGYLAFDSTVYYPEYPMFMWHGDMFSIPGWVCCKRNEDLPKLILEASKVGTERFGNAVLRNVAMSLIAKKFDLKPTYDASFESLGIDLYSGTKEFSEKVALTNENYSKIYHANRLDANIEASDYYQGKDITDMVYAYLQSIQEKRIKCNPFKPRGDVFVYIHIGDGSKYVPCIRYYLDVLSQIQFQDLHIATDNIEHAIVQQVLRAYPKASLYLEDEVTTLQFASMAKYLVLSNGAFSAVMGYLSQGTVYRPEYPTQMWHGDMFSIPGWNCHIIR